MHEVVLDGGPAPASCSHRSQTSGASGVDASRRRGDAQRARTGRGAGAACIAPTDRRATPSAATAARPRARRAARADAPCVRVCGRQPPARDRRDKLRPSDKDRQGGRNPQRVRQASRCKAVAQARDIAKFGIADHGRKRRSRPRGPGAARRQRVTPLLLKADRAPESAPPAAAPASTTRRADTTSRRATRHARPVHSATVVAIGSWQSCRGHRSTAAPPRPSAGPCFGKLVPSRISTPRRSGITARNRRQTRVASHGECVMKC